MSRHSITSQPATPIPADDLRRDFRVARPETDSTLPHIGLVGDTYTLLLTGRDTDGRYCLIDMHIPPGGGPPLHRHDFEESFILLHGEIEAIFRGRKTVVKAGETLSIPANSPHSFSNAIESTGPPAVYLRAGGAGRILRAGRRASRCPDRAAA